MDCPGRALLYAAFSLSLACLEILLHLRDPANLPAFVYAEIYVSTEDVTAWSRLDAETLPILESEELLREIGDRWLRNQSLRFTRLRGCPRRVRLLVFGARGWLVPFSGGAGDGSSPDRSKLRW